MLRTQMFLVVALLDAIAMIGVGIALLLRVRQSVHRQAARLTVARA